MGWDGVPFMVGGGALHSAEVGRLLAYLAFNGSEGIVGSADLKVTQTAVPGAEVQIAPGAAAIPCRSTGQTYQSYAGRCPSADTVAVAATGSGGGRVDMVVARVEDPWLAGEPWPDPPDATAGPYVFTRVLSNVDAPAVASPAAARAYLATQGMSAIPLAGLTIPASTGTIINSMITDLRGMSSPKRETRLFTINPGSVVNLTSATMVDWLSLGNVDIPSWATRAVITADAYGVRLDRLNTTTNGNAHGNIRVILGTTATQAAAYDEDVVPASVVGRFSLGAGDSVAIPGADRGASKTLRIQGQKVGGNKNIYADTGSFARVLIVFEEAPA